MPLSLSSSPFALFVLVVVFGSRLGAQTGLTHPGILRSEFIYTGAPIPSAHASTIPDTPQGLVVAWFGGSHEGADDVTIWLSRLVDGRWTAPVSVADGVQPGGRRY